MNTILRYATLAAAALGTAGPQSAGGQNSPNFTSLNGNWQLVDNRQLVANWPHDPSDRVLTVIRALSVVLRVDGNKIYGALDADLWRGEPDGRLNGGCPGSNEIRVQGDIAPDGSFVITNDPYLPPARTIFVHGVVPSGDDWSGSFSIPAFDDHKGHQCPAASGHFDAMRTQQDNGVYSGELKIAGTGEKAEVTLELSPGGLSKTSDGRYWTIGIDAKVTVSPTWFFKGGTFSTSPHSPSRMDARRFSAGFPDGDFPDPDAVHLTVLGYFSGSDENQIYVMLTHIAPHEGRMDASGVLTRK